jgi:hypothetical protein
LLWTILDSKAKRDAFKTFIHILLKDWYGECIEKNDHKGAIMNAINAMEIEKNGEGKLRVYANKNSVALLGTSMVVFIYITFTFRIISQ